MSDPPPYPYPPLEYAKQGFLRVVVPLLPRGGTATLVLTDPSGVSVYLSTADPACVPSMLEELARHLRAGRAPPSAPMN
jgi:hypothetical protein